MIGLDSNILLRWLLDDLIAHDDAPAQTALAKQLLAGNERFFINHIVLAEVVWVLRDRVGQSRRAIGDVIEQLLSSFDVEIDRKATVEAALALYRQYPGDFADHLLGAVNRDAGCSTTFTFDKGAAKSPHFRHPVLR